MRKIITLVALMANAFATPLFAQTAEEIFKNVFDNGEDYEIDEIGHISAYAFYDVDGDGISECFLKGEDGDYCMYCCCDANGKPDVKALALSLNSTFKTPLVIVQGKPYINVQGSCGTGCYTNSFAKVTKSHIEIQFDGIIMNGPNGEEDFEGYSRVPGYEGKEITKEEFNKLAPSKYKGIPMENLRWIKRKAGAKTNAAKPAINVTNATPATLYSQNGDTIILKDANGYFYQIMAADRVGVAPGGAYTGDVVIPSAISYDGATYLVTTVRRGAMWKKADSKNIGTITEVNLPETVTLVGADAFRDNVSLKDVTYYPGTRIEVRSFWGCPNLILESHPVKYAYTEPHYSDVNEQPDASKYVYFYYPVDEQDNITKNYQWVVFKHHHSGMSFNKWMNLNKENAQGCYCSNMKMVRAGVFTINDANNVNSMFKGNMNCDQEVLLAHNNYVAKHEFVMFSRYNYGEEQKSMPQSFVQAMAKKYGRKVKYSYEAAKALYTPTPEQLVITEFDITNHEAMIVLAWVKDGKEVCSYVYKQKTDPEYEEDSVWNVDDDGTYGIPYVISITKDETGNMEFFVNHAAPESTNIMHLVQNGNKLVLESESGWYNWIDAPEE